MEFIEYYPMLRHDQSTPRATAHGRIGSPAVRSGAAGPEAAARRPTVGAGRARPAAGAAALRLQHGAVDTASRGDGHRAPDGRALSRRPRVVHPARVAVVVATARAPGARAGRTGHWAMGGRALADPKKNARRRHAWLVFEDESGVSQQPVIRRTWAPR